MKINVNKLLVYLSLFLYFLIATVRIFFDSLFNQKISFVLYILAIVLLVISIIKNKKVKGNFNFVILCLLMFVPCLYNNAYIHDNLYSHFFYYLLTIIYAIFLSWTDLDEKDIKFFANCIIIFSLLTSIVSWITFFDNKFYINHILPFFNSSLQEELKRDLLYRRYIPGLTSHYSGNAYYILLGIIATFYKFKKLNYLNKKINILILIFLSMTFLFIGKRGHILFFLISVIICYLIYKKIDFKSILKLLMYGLIFALILILSYKLVPGIDYTIDKFFYNTSDDYSTGRFDMYKDAYRLYENNGNIPIGWGGYSKSTAYHHPALHNDYLQLFVETGIIGLLLIVVPNLIFLKKSKYVMQKKSDALSIIIFLYNIFFMLYSLTGFPHFEIEVYMIYFLLNAIQYKIYEGDKHE